MKPKGQGQHRAIDVAVEGTRKVPTPLFGLYPRAMMDKRPPKAPAELPMKSHPLQMTDALVAVMRRGDHAQGCAVFWREMLPVEGIDDQDTSANASSMNRLAENPSAP